MNMPFNPYTFSALPLVVLFNGVEISKATGFVVQHRDSHFLVSNLHVFSGLDALRREMLDEHSRIPDAIQVTHPTAKGGYVKQTYPLTAYNSDEPLLTDLWQEHPVLSWIADVAALPITLPSNAAHVPIFEADIGLTSSASRDFPYSAGLSPTVELDIIGYPFGRRGGYELFGVWTRATIASEPSIDFEGLPAFLVDSRTRSGNSGSPVVFYRDLRSFRDSEGEVHAPPAPFGEFVGIYSHRLSGSSDLGVVYRADAVRAVVTQEHS